MSKIFDRNVGMSLQSKFKQFNEAIYLTFNGDEYEKIREKDESILTKIKEAFKEAGHPVTGNFLQGSFATKTAIKSLKGDHDLDRGIIISADKSPDDPVEVKKVLRDVLASRGFKDPKIKKPCVTADYTSLKLHIDYPVYREGLASQLELGVGKEFAKEENKFWEASDPKGLIAWVNDDDNLYSSDDLQQYKRLIRYMKRWRDFVFTDEQQRAKVYSIALVVMVIENFKPNFENDGTACDVDSLLETVRSILNAGYFTPKLTDAEKFDVQVNLPKSPIRDIFTNHGTTVGTAFRNKLVKLRNKLEKVNEEEKLSKKCKLLREVFGADFPEGKDDNSVARAIFSSAGVAADNSGA